MFISTDLSMESARRDVSYYTRAYSHIISTTTIHVWSPPPAGCKFVTTMTSRMILAAAVLLGKSVDCYQTYRRPGISQSTQEEKYNQTKPTGHVDLQSPHDWEGQNQDCYVGENIKSTFPNVLRIVIDTFSLNRNVPNHSYWPAVEERICHELGRQI